MSLYCCQKKKKKQHSICENEEIKNLYLLNAFGRSFRPHEVNIKQRIPLVKQANQIIKVEV